MIQSVINTCLQTAMHVGFMNDGSTGFTVVVGIFVVSSSLYSCGMACGIVLMFEMGRGGFGTIGVVATATDFGGCLHLLSSNNQSATAIFMACFGWYLKSKPVMSSITSSPSLSSLMSATTGLNLLSENQR